MDARRAAAASARLRLSAKASAMAARPAFSPRVRAAISPSFCRAKASQPFSSPSTPSSWSRSMGQCRSEQEGPTRSRSGPSRCGGLFQQGEGPLQVGPPDVAAVDHAQRQHALRRDQLQGRVQLLRRADQVEVDGGHRQPQRRGQVVAQVAEIGGQADFDLRRRRRPAARRPTRARPGPRRADPGPAPARRSGPTRPPPGQPADHFFVDRQRGVPAVPAARRRPPCSCPAAGRRRGPAARAACGCPAPGPR